MKLTKSKLKRMIKEELAQLAEIHQDSAEDPAWGQIGDRSLDRPGVGTSRNFLENWIGKDLAGLREPVPLEMLRRSMKDLGIPDKFLNDIIAARADASTKMITAYEALEQVLKTKVGHGGRIGGR